MWRRTSSLSGLVILASLVVSCATLRTWQHSRAVEEQAEQVPLAVTPVAEVHFATGSFVLDAVSRATLNDLVTSFDHTDTNLYLEVRGHADGSGSRSLNQRLAARRAEAVRTYLHRASGLPLTRIAVAVLSTSVPVAQDDTEEGRARNRRVVVVALR